MDAREAFLDIHNRFQYHLDWTLHFFDLFDRKKKDNGNSSKIVKEIDRCLQARGGFLALKNDWIELDETAAEKYLISMLQKTITHNVGLMSAEDSRKYSKQFIQLCGEPRHFFTSSDFDSDDPGMRIYLPLVDKDDVTEVGFVAVGSDKIVILVVITSDSANPKTGSPQNQPTRPNFPPAVSPIDAFTLVSEVFSEENHAISFPDIVFRINEFLRTRQRTNRIFNRQAKNVLESLISSGKIKKRNGEYAEMFYKS